MNFELLKNKGIAAAHALASLDMPKAEKLEKLTDLNAAVIEEVDDLVLFLPMGFGPLAKGIVDNPGVDAWQREQIAKPLAEAEYQAYDALVQFFGEKKTELETYIKTLGVFDFAF